jgi:tetraacyldisaccharide 4'-kinase
VRWLLIPLSAVYKVFLLLREIYFYVNPGKELPGFVISIGNIEIGGTGKTPVVEALAARLSQGGKKVVILTRGYKSNLKSNEMSILSGGKVIFGKKDLVHADEPMMLSNSLSACWIVVGAKRYENAIRAMSFLNFKPDFWLLDDGFQHRKICRNFDVVLVNRLGTRFYDFIFPVGFLREPVKALKRAHAILYSRSPLHGWKNQFALSFHTGPVLSVDGLKVDFKAFGKVGIVTALAHPEQFKATVESLGMIPSSFSYKRDHVAFMASEIEPILTKVDQIVITEKDFWRQPELWKLWKDRVYRVTQHANLPEEFVESIFSLEKSLSLSKKK